MTKKQNKWIIVGGLVVLFCMVMLGCNTTHGSYSGGNEDGNIKAELFYLSPCESCKENIKFEQQLREELQVSGNEKNLTCIAYNVFRENDRKYMEKRLEEIGESVSLDELPVAVLDGKIYKGDYQEIGQQMGQQLSADVTAAIDAISGIKETDSVFVVFTTFACDSCEKVSNYLDNCPSSLEVMNGDKAVTSEVKVIRLNILEDDNLTLLESLMKIYDVPSEQQQVPIIFYQNGYLSGQHSITTNLMDVAVSGEAVSFDTTKFQYTERTSNEEKQGESESNNIGYVTRIFVTGLLNGLNPCAASMLLMVLSILIMAGNKYLPGSLAYMGGKIIAYMGLGLGTFWILSYLKESTIMNMEKGLSFVFAGGALLLCILNFCDYLSVRQHKYGKIIVQLPEKLRNLNHLMISRLKEVPITFLIPALFVLGLLISIGEFFCTGQLFVASIFVLSKQNNMGELFSVTAYLFLYVMAMCIPQLVLIIIIWKTRSMFAASKLALEGMGWIKLIYALVFLGLFLMLVFV